MDLLRAYGYAVAEATHDCGHLAGLTQSRKRSSWWPGTWRKCQPSYTSRTASRCAPWETCWAACCCTRAMLARLEESKQDAGGDTVRYIF